MKKLIFILFLLVFLLSSVSACQYKDNNPYQKETIIFYENGSKLDYNLLEVKDVKQGNPGSPYWGGAYGMEFKVYNNYNLEVNVTTKYLFNGQLQAADSIIASKGYSLVTGPSSAGLDETSIYFMINTLGLEAKKELITLDNYTCEQCPAGSNFTCLDDGQTCNDSISCGGNNCINGYCSHSKTCFNNDCKCNSDEVQCADNTQCVKKNSIQLGFKPVCRIEECITGYLNKNGACALKNGETCSIDDDCVSGICNIAKVCGSIRVVLCSNETKNCNNISCLIPSVKQAEEPYSCDWECNNQTLPCEGLCKIPSISRAGAKYNCVWECKSGKGKDGVCEWGVKEWVYFWVIIFIVILVSYLYIGIKEGGKIKKQGDVAKKELNEIIGKKDKLSKDLEEIIKNIINLNKSKENLDEEFSSKQKEFDERLSDLKRKENYEIEKLKEKKKKASKEAEKRINEEIEKRKEDYQNSIRILDNSFLIEKNKFHKMLEENTEKIEDLKEAEKRINEAIERLNNLKLKQNASIFQLSISSLEIVDGYIKFKQSKKGVYNEGDYLHHWVAKKEIFNKYRDFFQNNYPNRTLDNGNLIIHHINDDKLDNYPRNLAIITPEQHDLIKNIYIPKRDWNAGIKQLIKYKIKQPHIKELN